MAIYSPRAQKSCCRLRGGNTLGTATPPCPDHAGSAPNTLTGAEVALFGRMFLRRRIGRIELTKNASGGRHRGSHRAAMVAYVLLIFGPSKTVVGRTSPYVPRVSACSRKYGLKLQIWIQRSWKAWKITVCTGVVFRERARHPQSTAPWALRRLHADSRCHACAAKAIGLSRGLRMLGQEYANVCKS